MEFCRRRLQPGELDHESLWLGVSLAGLVTAALWLGLGFPWPQCTFLRLTGHPCLTCGATRAAIEFFHGHFLAAFRWNPLAFVLFCGVAAFDIYATLVLVTGAPRLRVALLTAAQKKSPDAADTAATTGRWIRLLVVVMLALNWIYLLSNSARFAS